MFLITSVICPLTDQLSSDRRVTHRRKHFLGARVKMSKFCCEFTRKEIIVLPEMNIKKPINKSTSKQAVAVIIIIYN